MQLKALQLKRALHRILLVIMLSAMGVTETLAATVTIGDLTYVVDFNTLTATVARHKDGSNATGTLTIPESITYLGLDFSVTKIGYEAFDLCKNLTGDLIIPNSIITIGNRAFNNCIGFTGSLIIPNSVTTIGYDAFQFCTGFNGNLIIGNSVISIGDNAFSGCSGFTGDLIIPNSVTTIGNSAFTLCHGFTGTLTIPNSVATIGNYAFSDCSGFIGGLVIPNSVTTIGEFAFSGCSNFTGNLTIGNSVTTIGKYAFCNCSGLMGNLVIPNSVSTIGECAFEDCNGFTGSLTIGNSVTTIDIWAFINCSGLMEINVLGIIPPSLGSNVFFGTDDCPIYVPYESLNAYKTATDWNYYEFRIFPMAYTTALGYGGGSGNYRFIASPLVEDTDPTTVYNLITETEYDLYCFNQSEELEWMNYEAHIEDFVLENGHGYLYANDEDVNVIFKGVFNEDETKEIDLVYDADADFAGWNLVGNPFPINAYADKSYYKMNENGTAIEPMALSAATVIPTCTGVMVKADNPGEVVSFYTQATRSQDDQPLLHITLSQVVNGEDASIFQDKAILSFNPDDQLEKFIFNKENAKISIPKDGKDFSIACVKNENEMQINFKAAKNGQYTLNIDPNGEGFDYLHLIDYRTGTDINLLQMPEYNFNATTADYESRFKLLFFSRDEHVDNAPFAYYSDEEIRIVAETGHDALLQIVDVMGRVIHSGDAKHCVSTTGLASGMYVLLLVNGKDLMTQKIVIQ